MACTALQTLAAMSRPSSDIRVRDSAHARELFDGVYAEFVEKANMDPEHAIPSVLAMLDLTFDAEGLPQWAADGEETIKGDAAIEYAWRNNVHVVFTLTHVLHAHQFMTYGGGFKDQNMAVRYQQIMGVIGHLYKITTTYFGLRAFSDRNLLSLCASTPVTELGGMRLDCIDPRTFTKFHKLIYHCLAKCQTTLGGLRRYGSNLYRTKLMPALRRVRNEDGEVICAHCGQPRWAHPVPVARRVDHAFCPKLELDPDAPTKLARTKAFVPITHSDKYERMAGLSGKSPFVCASIPHFVKWACGKTVDPTAWYDLYANSKTEKSIAEYLETCLEPELPELVFDRHLIAFLNGAYDMKADRFFPYVCQCGAADTCVRGPRVRGAGPRGLPLHGPVVRRGGDRGAAAGPRSTTRGARRRPASATSTPRDLPQVRAAGPPPQVVGVRGARPRAELQRLRRDRGGRLRLLVAVASGRGRVAGDRHAVHGLDLPLPVLGRRERVPAHLGPGVHDAGPPQVPEPQPRQLAVLHVHHRRGRDGQVDDHRLGAQHLHAGGRGRPDERGAERVWGGGDCSPRPRRIRPSSRWSASRR